MAFNTSPNPRNLSAARKMRAMYSKQFGLRCELCQKDSFGRRFRCNGCQKLTCRPCVYVSAKDHGGPLCLECGRKD